MALSKRRAAQVFAAMALIGLLLVSAPATACLKTHHGGAMAAAGNRQPQDPVVSRFSNVAVNIKDYDFLPRDLTVPAGTTVTWLNRDNVPHDATDREGRWATGMLQQGQDASLVFDEPGSFEYRCSIHPDMTAKLVVDSLAAAKGSA